MLSVLDLPIERQKELAKQDGYIDDLHAWQQAIKKKLDNTKAWLAERDDRAKQNMKTIFDYSPIRQYALANIQARMDYAKTAEQILIEAGLSIEQVEEAKKAYMQANGL